MPKLSDPRMINTGLVALVLSATFYMMSGAEAKSREASGRAEAAADLAGLKAEAASIKAEAASDKAESVAAELRGFDRWLKEFCDQTMKQLDRIEARLLARDHVGDFPMIPVPSLAGGLHSIGYDVNTGCLYVRFLTDARLPGAIYRYAGVTPAEFLSLAESAEPDEWVWDNLRVRGTFSGHQRDYELVGVGFGGVPRKAVYREGGEWFVPRTVLGETGEWVKSGLPEEKIEH